VSNRTDLIPAAVAAARGADVAVVYVGDLAGLFQTGTVGEGSDADSLDLPGVQQQLLAAVVATGTPVVAVLVSGRPYNLGGLEDDVAAFVVTFASGQEGGPALVDVLTGAVEPSGRLTVSVPRNVGAVPYYYNHKMKSAGTPIARHFGSRFPFGHGLAYTQFEFTDIAPDATMVDAAGEIRVRQIAVVFEAAFQFAPRRQDRFTPGGFPRIPEAGIEPKEAEKLRFQRIQIEPA
jgi:beta-glucosidase